MYEEEKIVITLCKEPGCKAKIEKTQKYACGNSNKISCGQHFCDKHRWFYILPDNTQRCTWLCKPCHDKKQEA